MINYFFSRYYFICIEPYILFTIIVLLFLSKFQISIIAIVLYMCTLQICINRLQKIYSNFILTHLTTDDFFF